MKKFFLLFVLFVAMNIRAYEYIPLLTNGKCWKVRCMQWTYDPTCEANKFFTVVGDTLVNNKHCKKILISGDGWSMMGNGIVCGIEEEGKIYVYDGQNVALLLDFNLHVGDAAYLWPNTNVLNVDYITVNGVQRKRLTIGYMTEVSGTIYWVEGIGTNNGYWMFLDEYMLGHEEYLVEVSENGKVIFTRDDFYATSDIKKTKYESQKTDRCYSLDGRYIDSDINTLKPGVYVINGKKVVK